jgi:catechol 2,3-dioxygenase-like lactoylglutathione lyase family enzyme
LFKMQPAKQKSGEYQRNRRKWVGLILISLSTLHAQTPQRPRIVGIANISLLAHDCAKSRAYYSNFLGFQEPYILKNPDGSPSMMFFKVNDHQYVEISPELQPGTDRLIGISLETDDVEKLRLYLASKGVKVPDHVHRDRIGNLVFDVIDPEGHTVEMTQYLPDGKTMLAKGQYMREGRVSKRMEHVGIVVTHLDPEYKFYTEILGLRDTYRGSRFGTVLSWINLTVPEGDDYLELMLFKETPTVADLGAQHHFDLQVPDLAATIAALEAKPEYEQYRLQTNIHHLAPNHKLQTNAFDPDGTRTEIMEPDTHDGKPSPTSTAPPP